MKTITDSKISQLDALFEQKSRIAIVVHQHPDGDALGSSSALYLYLSERFKVNSDTHETSGKSIRVIVPDAYPASLEFITRGVKIINAELQASEVDKYLSECDLLICLDLSSFKRTASLQARLEQIDATKLVIDHHPDLDGAAFSLAFSEPDISSTCELLYWILKKMGRISVPVAQALLTGMTTDTNNFANSTTPSTLQMASDLLALGADRDAILTQLYSNYRENRFRMMGYMLHKLLTITEEGLAYVIIDKGTAAAFNLVDGETEGFVNLALGIESVNVSLLLKEDDGHFRVSLRSKEGVNCTEFAQKYFHGGGHQRASGGKLFFPGDIASPKDVAAYIENAAAEYLNN